MKLKTKLALWSGWLGRLDPHKSSNDLVLEYELNLVVLQGSGMNKLVTILVILFNQNFHKQWIEKNTEQSVFRSYDWWNVSKCMNYIDKLKFNFSIFEVSLNLSILNIKLSHNGFVEFAIEVIKNYLYFYTDYLQSILQLENYMRSY